MRTRSILSGQRLDEAQTERVLADFHRDGYALVSGVLTAGEVAVLRAVTDRCFADPALQGTKYIQGECNHVPVADSSLAGDDGRLRRAFGLPAAG